MSKVGTLASEVCLLKVTWVQNLNSIRLSYYSIGKKRKRRERRKVTGHFVSPHGVAAEYVGSGGARTEGVTSWYIDIGDCKWSCEHRNFKFWYGERLKGYSKNRRLEYHKRYGGGKSLMYQRYKHVALCRAHGVLHKDLTPHNLLLDKNKLILKIAGLGLARVFNLPIKKYTHEKKGVMKNGLGTYVTTSLAAWFAPAISSNPVYVIKARVMNMKVVEGVEPPYKWVIDCAVNTVEAEVPMALYDQA
ncbi:mitochondrial dicarboxylate carrier [Tanacetum coccineum]